MRMPPSPNPASILTSPKSPGFGITAYGIPQSPIVIELPKKREGKDIVPADDKRVSQISTSSGKSGGSDGRRKTHVGPWRLGRTLGRGSSGKNSEFANVINSFI